MTNTAKLIKDNNIEIRFTFDWATLELVKSLPGRRFQNDTTGKYWTVPMDASIIKKLKDAGFKLCPSLSTLNSAATEIREVHVPNLKKNLFPFQKKGVSFIEQKRGRALIADEMGLGKTIQALAWLQLHPELRPAIVLCPAHLKLNWAQEANATLSGNLNLQILFGKDTTQALTGDIIIINYDILANDYETIVDPVTGKKKQKEIVQTGWVDFLIALNPRVLVFDEAHYIKSNSAQRTKATKKLAKRIPHIIGLSGTPIVNRPIEGFNIAQIINKAIFPDFWKYARTFCNAKHNGFGWDFTGSSNKEELHKKLTESFMIRRKKADVLPELPDKIRSFVPMDLSNKREYLRAEMAFIEYLHAEKGLAASIKAQKAEHLTKIETLKQLAVRGKINQALDWIQDFLEDNDEKLVIFTTHKEIVDTLMNEFRGIAVKVDGSVTAQKRDLAVKAFQNDPRARLFIGNIQAAGTGLTLTAASTVIFLELPWTPGELVQAEDRCHRIGQKNAVNIYYLLAAGTIEEKIAGLLDEKRKVLEAVLDGREVEETQLLTELIKSYRRR